MTRDADNLVDHLLTGTDSSVPSSDDLRGFSVFHGGLALALMGKAMMVHEPERQLVSLRGSFHRSIRGPLEIDATVVRQGRTATVCEARAFSGDDVYVSASAVLAPAVPPNIGRMSPGAPQAPEPLDCEPFVVPPEFVPISSQTEIRPVGPNRPYAGGSEPVLTSWVRLMGIDEPPDTSRLIFLMDALAPSHAAVMSDLASIPTVELTVNLTNVCQAPWILLEARTEVARPDGWVLEHINAWDESGSHVAFASQLRRVTAN